MNGLSKFKDGSYQENSLEQLIKAQKIQYIDFPEALKGKYQSFTQANLDHLRSAGYEADFLTVDQGVSRYVAWMSENTDFLASKV